jgi:hypothetical protein
MLARSAGRVCARRVPSNIHAGRSVAGRRGCPRMRRHATGVPHRRQGCTSNSCPCSGCHRIAEDQIPSLTRSTSPGSPTRQHPRRGSPSGPCCAPRTRRGGRTGYESRLKVAAPVGCRCSADKCSALSARQADVPCRRSANDTESLIERQASSGDRHAGREKRAGEEHDEARDAHSILSTRTH